MYNGQITCTRTNSFMSVCTFSCDDGFELDGNSTMICQSDGTWSQLLKPYCRRKFENSLRLIPFNHFENKLF